MARYLNNPVRVLFPLLLALVLIVAVACGSAEQPADAPADVAKDAPAAPVAESTKAPEPEVMAPSEGKYGQHVNMWAYADTRDWDPIGSASLSSVISYSQLYNQLVQYDTANLTEVVCDLCAGWEVSNGGQTFTFKIRDGIKWQDGADLTAEDVVYGLQRFMNPEISIGRSGLFRNYTLTKEEGGVKLIDPLTVEINLQFPSAAFLKFLAIDYVKILPKHLDDVDLNQAENLIASKSGSGPFILQEYQRGNFYKVTKNPNYFKEGRPYFDSIDHFIIADRSRAIASAKANQVDMRNSANSYDKEVVDLPKNTNGEWIVHALPPTFNVGLMINVKKEPFSDSRVRRAIYLALDRQQINELVMDGTGGATTIFAPGMAYSAEEAATWPGLRPKDTPGGQEDLAEAKRLMAEAGFPDGFETTYDARQISFYVPLCQVIKEQLKAALGIDGNIRTWESAAGYQHYNLARPADAEGDWELACQGEGTTVLDFDGIYGGVYQKGATRNYTDWTHPLIDDLFERQKVEQDSDKRIALNREASDFLRSFEDNHFITAGWGGFFWPHHRDVRGLGIGETVQYNFKHEDLWLDR